MTVFAIVLISVILGVLTLLFFIKIFFNNIKKRLNSQIKEKFKEKDIIKMSLNANFFGEKSKGSKQIRGNGALVLTKDQLFFVLAFPTTEYSIPLKSIKKISNPSSFNKKTIAFSKLLCVEYIIDGNKDSIAWAVSDPVGWKKVIKKNLG